VSLPDEAAVDAYLDIVRQGLAARDGEPAVD